MTNKKCLLADPNKTSKLNILKHLLKWKLKPSTCDSIDEVELYLSTGDFDLIITDRIWESHFSKFSNVTYLSPRSTDLKRPVCSDMLLRAIIKHITVAGDKDPYDEISQGDTIAKKSKPLTILLVEDNYINRQIELERLSQMGFQHIDTAENGLQAIERMKDYHYDVLLLDLKMPVMDGYETFNYLLEHKDIRPNYTIALTGNAL